MNKRIKKLWIAALRSGKFEQTGEVMRDVSTESGGYRYCCLGVLEQIRCNTMGGGRFTQDSELLSEATQQWAGLESNDPELGKKSAADLNDEGKSFKYIADRIEKYL